MCKILTSMRNTLKTIEFIHDNVSQIKPLVISLTNIDKIHPTYLSCLNEIERRNVFAEYISNVYESHGNFLRSIENNETIKRAAFRQNHGEYVLHQLMPFLISTEEQEKKKISAHLI